MLSYIFTAATTLVTSAVGAIGTMASWWIFGIIGGFFVLALGAKFLLGLLGRSSKRRRGR